MTDPRAKPLAESELEKKLIKLVKDCIPTKQIKKGANECAKALNRQQAELIIIAADASPLELVLHLPLICEDKDVQFCYVASKQKLGQACGTTREVTAVAITKNANSRQNETINKLRNEVEVLYISS